MNIPKRFDICIYHANCMDGMFAAAAVMDHSPGVELVPAQYGSESPHVAGKHVAIVDFSYPRAVLEEMSLQAESLLVLDHHETAARDLEGLKYAVFDQQQSGASLAWRTLRESLPSVVQYVEDRDLWRWQLSFSREVNEALALRVTSPEEALSVVSDWDLSEVACTGSALRKAKDLRVKRQAACAFEGYIEDLGRNVVFCCASTDHSELGNHLAGEHLLPAVLFWRAAKAPVWRYSVRSLDQLPSALEIAEHFGGGGHRNAAGFALDGLICGGPA